VYCLNKEYNELYLNVFKYITLDINVTCPMALAVWSEV